MSENIEQIERRKGFYSLLVLVTMVLVAIRCFTYFLHGPFGFGYDTGIYRKVFQDMTAFSDIFSSQIYILPSFLAYLFNLMHLPVDWLLYHGYIIFSVLTAWPLYLLTKRFFGKVAGLISVAIFAVSYVQVLASEYYLFKEMLGAIFMLFGFLYYEKRSNWFYLFAVLMALTQLPQFLVLAVGTGLSAIVNFKKDWKFNLKGLGIMILAGAFLAIFTPQHLVAAWNVVIGALNGAGGFNPHQSGSFISLAEFIYREWFFFGLGCLGFIAALRKKGSLFLQISVIFLVIVVFFQLFFERRYLIELSLVTIPYAAYVLAGCYSIIVSKIKWLKYILILMFLVGFGLTTVYHYSTTYPALNKEEQWALQILIDKTDSYYVMATNSYYAPWLYGFSGKTTLAPGIFISPWNVRRWNVYMEGSSVDQASALIKIANQYGKYYVMEGVRQVYTRADKASLLVKRIFDVNGVRIYEVFQSPSPPLSPQSPPLSSPSQSLSLPSLSALSLSEKLAESSYFFWSFSVPAPLGL